MSSSLSYKFKIGEPKGRIYEDLFVMLMGFLPRQESVTKVTKEQLLEKLIDHILTLQPPRDMFPLLRYEWRLSKDVNRWIPIESHRVYELVLTLASFLPKDMVYPDLETVLKLIIDHFFFLQSSTNEDNNFQLERLIKINGKVKNVWVKSGEKYEDTVAKWEEPVETNNNKSKRIFYIGCE